VTVEDADALDCGVCFFSLKSPIFQCQVGHVVCAPCRDKLEAAAGRFRQCHAMERLVESVSVPCPHAAHGCGAQPVYHRRDAHARVCAHAPCRCPDEACRFAASMAELLLHLAAAHGWPCFTKTSVGDIVSFTVELRHGFNFVRAAAGNGKGPYHLFLLNTAKEDAAP
jgi:E3 ubiquitin-protein ligase SIAH1